MINPAARQLCYPKTIGSVSGAHGFRNTRTKVGYTEGNVFLLSDIAADRYLIFPRFYLHEFERNYLGGLYLDVLAYLILVSTEDLSHHQTRE